MIIPQNVFSGSSNFYFLQATDIDKKVVTIYDPMGNESLYERVIKRHWWWVLSMWCVCAACLALLAVKVYVIRFLITYVNCPLCFLQLFIAQTLWRSIAVP